jgi:hypothetical protein
MKTIAADALRSKTVLAPFVCTVFNQVTKPGRREFSSSMGQGQVVNVRPTPGADRPGYARLLK